MLRRCLCCCVQQEGEDPLSEPLMGGKREYNGAQRGGDGKVFGVKLTEHGNEVPFVVMSCIMEIESRGLESEGIYRKSGRRKQVLELKRALEEGNSSALRECGDIHAVTGVLKLYFRELPHPLITPSVYTACLSAVGGESVEGLREALHQLPPAHYNTLKFLLEHLFKVQLSQDQNQMTISNLATIFSPNVMQTCSGDTVSAVQELGRQQKLLGMLITHCSRVF